MDRIFLTVNEISALIAVHLERLLLYQLINPSLPEVINMKLLPIISIHYSAHR